MTHKIPYGDWIMKLTDAIEAAADGDVIECHSEDMAKVAELTRNDMFPLKRLTFDVPRIDMFPPLD